MKIQFQKNPDKPYIIAGPCVAESLSLIDEIAHFLSEKSKDLNFDLIFKASFDKANRTSINSYRGPGIHQVADWFMQVKSKYNLATTTDIHETNHAAVAAEFCDVLQIPAFLCRQTDLIVAAVETGRAVTVKKGQFLAPESCSHIVAKVKEVALAKGISENLALIERGASFGYSRLVVDMPGIYTMERLGFPVIFDITHSTQMPSGTATTLGQRWSAPLLARAAAATGYLSGFFLEVHPDPKIAKSDAATQLSMKQADTLLSQIIPLLQSSRRLTQTDGLFL